MEHDEMRDYAMQTEIKKVKLQSFENNQERWLHSKYFLSKGEIAEKDMLYLRPITETLAMQKVSKGAHFETIC